jgi:hypothetical protein
MCSVLWNFVGVSRKPFYWNSLCQRELWDGQFFLFLFFYCIEVMELSVLFLKFEEEGDHQVQRQKLNL